MSTRCDRGGAAKGNSLRKNTTGNEMLCCMQQLFCDSQAGEGSSPLRGISAPIKGKPLKDTQIVSLSAGWQGVGPAERPRALTER